MDDWFSVLVNGGVDAYSANQSAKAAVASANANAAMASRTADALAQQRMLQLTTDAQGNQRMVMWGFGLFALLFLVRATGRV